MTKQKRPHPVFFIALFILVGIGLPPVGILMLFDDYLPSNFAPGNGFIPIFMIFLGVALGISYKTWNKGGGYIVLAILAFGFLNFKGCSEGLDNLASIH
jgi:hypothetical protein